MIAFSNVTHSIIETRKRETVLRDFSGELPEGRYVIVAEEATISGELVQLCVGSIKPQFGRIRCDGEISWPIGNNAHFRSYLSGEATVEFFAEMYSLDSQSVCRALRDLAGIDRELKDPILQWPSSVLQKFSLTLALLPKFEIYIVDGSILHPDGDFCERWLDIFEHTIADSSLIMRTSQRAAIHHFAKSALIASNGTLITSNDVATAIELYTVNGVYKIEKQESLDDDSDFD